MIEVTSVSRAEDAGYHAVKDIADIAVEINADYRLIGGHMATLLVAAHQVLDVPARETADADLGADFSVIADPALVTALRSRGYGQPESSNRFARDLGDNLYAVIDILGPSFTGHHKSSQKHGELYVDTIPGLSWALASPPERIEFTATLTDAKQIAAVVSVPSPLPALCLKLHSYRSRVAGKDVRDIWRLLAVCQSAGITPADWTSATAKTAKRIVTDLAAIDSKPLAYHFPDRRQRAQFRALAKAVAG